MSDSPQKLPSFRVKNWRPLILFLLILIAILAMQWVWRRALAEAPFASSPWLGVAIAVVAAGLLWLGRKRGQFLAVLLEAYGGGIYALLWRGGALVATAVLIIYVLITIPSLSAQSNYTRVAVAWAGAILLYLAAVTPASVVTEWRYRDWRDWVQRNKRLLLVVANLLLLAFILRAWRLATIPYTLSGDEASQGLEAIRVLRGEIRSPFTTGWLGVPTLSFFFNSLTIRWFGRTVVGLRLPWAFVGTATVGVTFLLVRRLKGTRLGVVAATLLALYHYHIHFSRLGSNQIADPLFMSVALYFLCRGLDRRNRLDWALCGTAVGFAFYFYAGARLTPVVITAVLAYHFLRHPRDFWQQYRGGLLVATMAFLVTAAPMVQYAVRFPNDFNARLNQVGIIQSGWLEQEVEIHQQSMATILFDQFKRAALAFNFYPDRTVWYGLRQPLLDPFFGSIFMIGLLYATARLVGRRPDARLAPMVAWWWGGMLLGGMLTESPPSSQRLITLAVPTCFFIALALWELLRLATRAIDGFSLQVLLAISVFLFGVVSLKIYFLEFTPQRISGGPHAGLATEIAPRLNELSSTHHFYFVGAPWMYWGFATLPYLVPSADANDIIEPLNEPISDNFDVRRRGEVYIILPQRLSELEQITATFPEGRREDVYSPVDGDRLMVTLYVVAP